MLNSEVVVLQDSLFIRARGAELFINSLHVHHLQALKEPKDFSQYFFNEALVNRSARKLFEAWLRKDNHLWQKIYKNVMDHKLSADALEEIKESEAPEKKVSAPVEKKQAAPKAKKEPEKKASPKKLAAEPKVKKTAAPTPKKTAAKKPAAKKK